MKSFHPCRDVGALSVWNRMGQPQCLFTLGPLGELWWGFVRSESHHQILHQPLTAAKRWLGLSMQGSTQLGSIPYIFLKKIWSILGEESACYAGGETWAALPALRAATFHTQPPCLGRAGWAGDCPCSCQNEKLSKDSLPLPRESQWMADLSQLSGDFFISQGMVFPGVISNQPVS